MNPEKLPVKNFNQSDKLLHFSAYFVLTITWYLYYFSRKEWSWVFLKPIVIICLPIIAFGIFIEVLQGTLTTYRTIDSLDALANSIGVSLAFILIVSFKEKLKKVKSQL
ncbi:MAG: teicoplanin resistance protein VanZ [Mesonia sp.]|nr:teicoplanin resistance protein VanZ [Mesonia sp.]MAQ40304.1 teicoplanin resistance protein VanZ [Mesonia sp.]MBJ97215.1 teicoplanin resistance protein VanZ [Flavobacteriaceae bacterium]